MKTTIKVELTRPARKAGGDRYEGKFETGEEFTIYIPQSVSRKDGVPRTAIKVTFE